MLVHVNLKFFYFGFINHFDALHGMQVNQGIACKWNLPLNKNFVEKHCDLYFDDFKLSEKEIANHKQTNRDRGRIFQE